LNPTSFTIGAISTLALCSHTEINGSAGSGADSAADVELTRDNEEVAARRAPPANCRNTVRRLMGHAGLLNEPIMDNLSFPFLIQVEPQELG
jgi:hypothetical protein